MPVILCTLLHLTVDGVCGAALAAYAVNEPEYANIVYYFHLYSLVAFGGQWLAGLALDRKMNWILPGLALVPVLLGLGTLPGFGIFCQAVLLGVGNCIFHVAAGILILRRCPGYAGPGVFVSGGAIGLGLGINQICGPALFLCVCAAATAAVIFLSSREAADSGVNGRIRASGAPGARALIPFAAAALLLLCVTLRGFAGGGGLTAGHVMLFPCVFALGKALGGLCCDAVGYRRTIALIFMLSVVSLHAATLSLPGAWRTLPPLLLSLSFNMTMPLTLRLLHRCFPARPGLTFGLAAGCLLPGAFWRDSFTMLPHVMTVLQFLGLFAADAALRRRGA
jgi:hypothetical protein